VREARLSVDLVEIDTGWRSYGAGISIGGRRLRTVGVLDAFFEHGHGGDGVNLFTAAGHPIGTLPTPRVAGDDVPGSGAIMRPRWPEFWRMRRVRPACTCGSAARSRRSRSATTAWT
jgi:hypothetical protein